MRTEVDRALGFVLQFLTLRSNRRRPAHPDVLRVLPAITGGAEFGNLLRPGPFSPPARWVEPRAVPPAPAFRRVGAHLPPFVPPSPIGPPRLARPPPPKADQFVL